MENSNISKEEMAKRTEVGQWPSQEKEMFQGEEKGWVSGALLRGHIKMGNEKNVSGI